MNKTPIEWCDYTINPVKGLCPVACPYCYARRMYKNPYSKSMYDHPEVRFEPGCFADAFNAPAGSRIFVGSTMELFGEWVKPEWLKQIMEWPKALPNKTFIFLTKRPENLARWSPFPPNCWVGVSATDTAMMAHAGWHLRDVGASVKFISLEPLLDWTNTQPAAPFLLRHGINWVIIGQQTPVRPATTPRLEWVREIVEAADKAGIPVFLKDNLKPLLNEDNIPQWETWATNTEGEMRQELPR